jgi:hypothetical protein
MFMVDPATLIELDERIATVREKIRNITDQASALHGAANESRSSDRIAALEEMLAVLIEEREALE